MTSIHYYNTNAQNFISSTFTADMSSYYEAFCQFLSLENAQILDIGCGSGRDSLWFKNQGYTVYAHDGSEEMVKHCSQYLGENVVKATFEQFHTDVLFDGLWACASLLHVPREQLISVIHKYTTFLKEGGVFFMSFKLRDEDYEKDSRQFTNMTEQGFRELIEACGGLQIEQIMVSVDVREDRKDEKWISGIVRKV